MIKFNKHNVTDTATKIKCRVWYSLDNHVRGKPCVTVYAKDYGRELGKILNGVKNDSDSMTDYFETDRVRFFEGDEHYAAARLGAERFATRRSAKRTA